MDKQTQRLANFIFWLIWSKLPAKDVQDCLESAKSYSPADGHGYEVAKELAIGLLEG